MYHSEEKPSIIREIFIYDKPNKPALPKDYLLKEKVTLTSGDIILTRSRTRGRKVQYINDPLKRELEDDEIEDEFQETSTNNIDNVVDFANSLIDDILSNDTVETPVEPVALPNANKGKSEFIVPHEPKRKYVKKQKSSLTEVLETPQKVDSLESPKASCTKPKTKPINIKSYTKKQVKGDNHETQKAIELIIENSTDNSKNMVEQSAVKGPTILGHKPPQEVSSKDKAKVLNFIIKHPNLDVTVLAPVRNDSAYLIDDVNPSEKIDIRMKRNRKLPKRYDNDDIMVEETVGHYPVTTANKLPAKKKKLEVESEEDDFFGEFTEESLPNVSDELLSAEEAYQSDDEDGPREWMPPEYAEYKQEFATKQVSAVEKKFSCKICKTDFDTYYGLRKHRAADHGDSGRKPAVIVEDLTDEGNSEELELKEEKDKMNKVLFKCKICWLTFTNYYKLTTHRREKHETAPNPYDCRECKEQFSSLPTLTAHIRGVHQGKNPYECPKCKKGFQTTEELNTHSQVHILQKPEVIKKYRCSVCAKEFGKLSDIERHSRVHTGEKPAECHICHKRFQQPHNLTKHLLIHMQVKPFQCEICHKKFGRIDVLNRHLLTHSVEKPFKCSFCEKSFIRQVQLSMHLDKCHPEADYGEVDDDELQ